MSKHICHVFAVAENGVVLAPFERCRGGIENRKNDSPLGLP